MPISYAIFAVFLWLMVSQAQEDFDAGVLYGNNIWPVIKDSDVVASAFPEINYELLSPAFLDPETISPGFPLGLRGPTNDSVMRE